MAEIRPFKGIRYNQEIVGDLGAVICPPYDVITPEGQHALYHKSPYNLVRVEYGLAETADSFWSNKYSRAAAFLQEWLEKKVLVTGPQPQLYLHHHYFNYHGEVKTRKGIMAAVRLEEWEKGVVRPHEGTAAVFKADRLSLMRACHTNVSPIFSLYQNPDGSIASILAETEKEEPLARVATANEESHTLWAIAGQSRIDRIAAKLQEQPLYIADGHHRYETALAYQKERQAAQPDAGTDAAFNYVMMTLVEFSDPGLVVLPYHRMVRGVPEPRVQALRPKLDRYFEVNAAPLNCPLSAAMLGRILKPVTGEQAVIGLLGLEKDRLLILRVKDYDDIKELMPGDRSQAYRSLDVSVLHHVLLSKLLGVMEDADIAYTKSEMEAWQRVAAGEYRLGFLLNPVDVYAIKAVADAADKMPQKSTHFHPKLPSGLVLNPLD